MTWTEAEVAFAAAIPGYEIRTQQRGLALAIEQALADEVHGLFQGGCGVGKSWASLIPSIDRALATGKPVIAATATKALQDQYLKDLQRLQTVYRPFRYAVLKGRSNYLCRAKLDVVKDTELTVSLDAITGAMESDDVWGDVERLPVTLTPVDRAQLVTGADECPGKKECPFGERCFAEAAKKRAAGSDVIVTNHAMVAIDAQLRNNGVQMLPERSALIIDEAHEFKDYVTSSLGHRISEGTFASLASAVTNFLADSSYSQRTKAAAQAFFKRLDGILGKDSSLALTPGMVVELGVEIAEVLEALEEMDTDLGVFSPESEADSLRKKRLRTRLYNLTNKIQALVLADFDEVVRWTERDDKRGVLLAQAPLDIAPFLQENVWSEGPAVLTSATLAVGDDFHYLADQVGLDLGPQCRTFDAGSPFDFTTQSLLYVPKDFPDPSETANHQVSSVIEMGELIKASDGRALLLFTSWKSLNATYDALTPTIEALGHRVFKQGEAPTRKLAEAFAADEHSVLFAVKSFFTGVDVQGDSLRLVVLFKLPFPNPSDIVFKARCDALDGRLTDRQKWTQGSFATMSVPEMTLTLQQVFGRLIRTMNDRGVVAIMDPRLHTKKYGKRVLTALPNAPLHITRAPVIEYLHSLDAAEVVA